MFRVSSVTDLEQVLADFRIRVASLTEASDFSSAETSPIL